MPEKLVVCVANLSRGYWGKRTACVAASEESIAIPLPPYSSLLRRGSMAAEVRKDGQILFPMLPGSLVSTAKNRELIQAPEALHVLLGPGGL